MQVDLRGSSLAVRGYYRIWARLPYVREGMIGVGVYALSEDGRRRFDAFPDVIADDGYVRMLFGLASALVSIMHPSASTHPNACPISYASRRAAASAVRAPAAFPRPCRGRANDQVLPQRRRPIAVRPWLWPAATVYAAVQFQSRRRANQQLASIDEYVWERDESSRRPSRR